MEDFSFIVSIGSWGPFHVRELIPKDLYFAQILRNKEKSQVSLYFRVIKNSEVLDKVPVRVFRLLMEWITENVFKQHLITVENWLEVSFHLCKQRWDSSIEWLEGQPMSKVFLMLDISKKFAEQQADLVKSK